MIIIITGDILTSHIIWDQSRKFQLRYCLGAPAILLYDRDRKIVTKTNVAWINVTTTQPPCDFLCGCVFECMLYCFVCICTKKSATSHIIINRNYTATDATNEWTFGKILPHLLVRQLSVQ